MKNLFTNMKAFISAHKKLSAFILIALLGGGYWVYGKMTDTSGETRYITTTATKGTLMTTVTGTGQVTTLDEVILQPKVSGEITSINVVQGDTVKAGQVIARIDATDAYKTLRDAKTSLESAKLTREDVLAPVDELTLVQSENSLARAKVTKQNAEDTLTKNYDDAFNSISNAFLDLPSIVSGLHDLLFTANSQLGGSNVNNIDYYASTANLYDSKGEVYGKDADAKYQIALVKYNKNFADYKALNRNASDEEILTVTAETYETALAVSDAVKSTNNLIQFFQDQMTQHNQRIPTLSNTQLSSLNTYTGTANSHLTSLLSIQNTIKSNKNTIVDATRSIEESTLSLAKTKAGATALEIRAQDLTVKQREDAVSDAQIALADYTIRAPFDGLIAKVSAQVGDTGGSGTAIATLIAKQQIVELTLNEVDSASVEVGQKATMTFDAVEDLSISGKVASIDTVGTVSSGVVSYTVQISFDTQDARVKSGMSANASIITEVKTDVLSVPSASVKSRNGTSYVLVFATPLANSSGVNGATSKVAPTEQTVTTGISDDTSTEIISGLKEGDQVVVKTATGAITTTATKTTTSSTRTPTASSILGGGGGPRD